MADELVRTAPPSTASKPAPATVTAPPLPLTETSGAAGAAGAAASKGPSPNAGLAAKPKQAGGIGGAEEKVEEGADWEEEENVDNVLYLVYK